MPFPRQCDSSQAADFATKQLVIPTALHCAALSKTKATTTVAVAIRNTQGIIADQCNESTHLSVFNGATANWKTRGLCMCAKSPQSLSC
jgi:hypothetical protein